MLDIHRYSSKKRLGRPAAFFFLAVLSRAWTVRERGGGEDSPIEKEERRAKPDAGEEKIGDSAPFSSLQL